MYAIERIDSQPEVNLIASISLRKASVSGVDLSQANLSGRCLLGRESSRGQLQQCKLGWRSLRKIPSNTLQLGWRESRERAPYEYRLY